MPVMNIITSKTYKNKKNIISAPTWNEGSELTNGSHSILKIDIYFQNIVKKNVTQIDEKNISINQDICK